SRTAFAPFFALHVSIRCCVRFAFCFSAGTPLKNLLVSLDQAGDFDEIIDVRTPLEFADDHIPGAMNAPVLSNEERVIVGTMYKQVSPFEATKVGAALVARN